MERENITAIDILSFYLTKTFSPNLFIRNFSENILLTISNYLNFPFLILKGLVYTTKCDEYSQWLAILMKRPVIFFSKNFRKSSLLKLLETMIEISINSSGKTYKLLEESIRILFYFNKEKKHLENFIFSGIIRILEEKLSLNRHNNFTHSILSLTDVLFSVGSNSLSTAFFDFFAWIISEYLLVISNFNLIYTGDQHLQCLNLLDNISNKIKNEVFTKKLSFDIAIVPLVMIWDFYFLIFYPNLFKKSFWKLVGAFENKFLISMENFEKDVVIFFPVFLGFYLLDLKSNVFYLNCKKVSILDFSFLFDFFNRIFDQKKISKITELVFENFCSNKNITKLSGNHFVKFFSIGDKFNHIHRKLYFENVLNSLESQKKRGCEKSLFSMDFIKRFFMNDSDLFTTINAFFLITQKGLNHKTGHYTNRFNRKIQNKFIQILNFDLNEISDQEFVFILDFLNNFRYQISIKKIFIFTQTIFRKQIKNSKIKVHVMNFFERILCTRGNDGEGVQLLDFYFPDYINRIRVSDLKANYSEFTCGSREVFLKLLLRIISRLEENEEFEKNQIRHFIIKILKKGEINGQNFKSFVVTMESIFFLIKNSNFNLLELGLNFENISKCIVPANQKESLPFMFEILTKLIAKSIDNSLDEIFVSFFKGICNPYIWQNKSLINSMVKFTESFVIKFSTTISNKIQIYILKIVTFIIKKQKKKTI